MAKALDVTMSACLEALDRGESVDSILSRYPAMATELRPFLETAVSLKSQPINPTIAAKSASLTAMKKEAAALRPQKRVGWTLFFQRARRFSPAMALFAMLIVLFMATIAPPSSPLYGARLFLDGLRGNSQENDGVMDVPVLETAVSPTISATMTLTGTAVLESTVTPTAITTTPSPTLTVSATPTATMTLIPTPSLTPSPTQILPTETATPQPVAPTATPDDDDDDDDDESDDPDDPDESDDPDEPDDD